jgi:competence protein ComEA
MNIKNYLKNKYIIKIILIIIIIFISVIILKTIEFKRNILINNIKLEENHGKVNVILSGAIKNPGEYYFDFNINLEEAIDLAGGLDSRADVSNLNFDRILFNKEKIEIPIKQKEIEESKENNSKININTADKNELKTLPGIGDSIAQKIVEYRENKIFENIEDIKNITGIGEVKYNLIKELITI